MKILCIDGGGIRGVFPAYILQKLEEQLEKPIYTYFDLVAGTSTGSIIAAAIASGKSMHNILHLYKRDGAKVFKRKTALAIFQTFYSSSYFKKRLEQEFGKEKLSNVHLPLLIPAVDLTKGRALLFRSYALGQEQSSLEEDTFSLDNTKDISILDAVMSSCAAPIYFPPHKINQLLAADGGLWANNPSLFSLTEGIRYFQTPIDEIKILSLGTGEQQIRYKANSSTNYWGLTKWLPFRFHPFRITPTLLDFALHLSSESISEQCQVLCKTNYLRVNIKLAEEVPFDELSVVEHLLHLAKKEYGRMEEELLHFITE